LATVTSTVDAELTLDGEVAVIDVAEFTTTDPAATVPNRTVSPLANPVPVIVTDVAVETGPLCGLTADTVGTGNTYVNLSALPVAEVPPAFATVTSTAPSADPAGEVAVIDVDEFNV
jgi:hypothetical protein